MKATRIYISGAIAHHDLSERRKAFTRAEKYIRDVLHAEPVNPFNNGVPSYEDWRVHMKADIKLLLECDGIVMLRGWETSKGAKLEFDVATSCGIQVVKFNAALARNPTGL